jgi:FixJ family two-component response regulator
MTTVRPEAKPRVFVVDDDHSILAAMSRLLGLAGYDVETFESPGDFLAHHDPQVPGCALLDIGLGETDGLALQNALVEHEPARPIIFLTGCDDVTTGVRAMKAGAVDYLTKPVHETELLAAIERAIEADRKSRAVHDETAKFGNRLEKLTPREREVMVHVVRGRLNKQIANDLGIVEKTVKVHRARVMEKLGVRSVATLVQAVLKLDTPAKMVSHQ